MFQHGRWMTAEDFHDFFEVDIGMFFYEMQCLKSCYLCDLELVSLCTVVEQVVFFLVNRTTDVYFYVAGCLISPFLSNNRADIYFEHGSSLCQ